MSWKLFYYEVFVCLSMLRAIPAMFEIVSDVTGISKPSGRTSRRLARASKIALVFLRVVITNCHSLAASLTAMSSGGTFTRVALRD
jgi:hypothetical protein